MPTTKPTAAAEEYAERETGSDPFAHDPIDVRVVEKVHVSEQLAPVAVVTDQIPVTNPAGTGGPVKVVSKTTSRANVTIRAVGADVYLGNRTVTPGTGFLVPAGSTPLTLTLSGELYAITAADVAATVHTLTQLREAML